MKAESSHQEPQQSSVEEHKAATIIESVQKEDSVLNREKLMVNIVEEPKKITDPSTQRPKKELPKQSQLGAMLKDIHQQVVTNKEENKTELTEDSIIPLWKEFLADNKGRLQNAFFSVAERQLPQLNADVIVFTETNNISLELLQLHKMDILSFYRKRTTCTTASLDFKLQRNESKQKNYKTPKDRLKQMIVENPSVLKLIEKLDLNEY